MKWEEVIYGAIVLDSGFFCCTKTMLLCFWKDHLQKSMIGCIKTQWYPWPCFAQKQWFYFCYEALYIQLHHGLFIQCPGFIIWLAIGGGRSASTTSRKNRTPRKLSFYFQFPCRLSNATTFTQEAITNNGKDNKNYCRKIILHYHSIQQICSTKSRPCNCTL